MVFRVFLSFLSIFSTSKSIILAYFGVFYVFPSSLYPETDTIFGHFRISNCIYVHIFRHFRMSTFFCILIYIHFRMSTCACILIFRVTTGYSSNYLRFNIFFILLIRNGSIFYWFIHCSNIWRSFFRIHNWLFTFFSVTTVASTSSPNSPTVLKYSSTSTKTDASILLSVTTDAPIASSSFKIYSNSWIMTLMLNN